MTRQYEKRYTRIQEKMDLLGITDVSTPRQEKNGTIVWRLPIKNSWNNGKLIEVASFKTGYVRNQNSGYSNYQLNKRCESESQYYPERKYIDGEYKETGKHLQYTTRGCKLIPNEIDRLEYLISYCLKNYYIKRANEITDGKYVSKWYHEFELGRANSTYGNNIGAMDRINDMEENLKAMTDARDYYKTYKEMEVDKVRDLQKELDVYKEDVVPEWLYTDAKNYSVKLEEKMIDLQTKLAEIQRIADHG